MSEVVLLGAGADAGAPASFALARIQSILRGRRIVTRTLLLHDAPASDALHPRTACESPESARDFIATATGIVLFAAGIRTAISGALTAFLHEMPESHLRDTSILTVIVGGRRPDLAGAEINAILARSGANRLLPGIAVTDQQAHVAHGGGFVLDSAVEWRLRESLASLAAEPVRAA